MTSARYNPGAPRRQRRTCRRFTLVELITAMAVLVIIMFLLFQFFGSAQRAVSLSTATIDAHEKGRVVMDILTRELQGAFAWADDTPGNDITFSLNGGILRFATTSQLTGGSADACSYEVTYQLDTSSYELQRGAEELVFDGTSWNGDIYDGATGTPEKVIDGVLGLEFRVYQRGNLTPAASYSSTELPAAVHVQVTLLDDSAFRQYLTADATRQADIEQQQARVFSKIIFLGGRR